MGDNDFYKIDKLMPYKTHAGRTYIQDGNLQINSPHIKDLGHTENAQAFNKLLTYYTKEVSNQHVQVTQQAVTERDSIKAAMQDAEQTFNSMMEIGKQLRLACQEIMQMQ